MKNKTANFRAFTLIELLVVIAVIAILAGLLLSAIARAKLAAKKGQAKTEIQGIVAAINAYETAYSRLPLSSNVVQALSGATLPDYTFGTVSNGVTMTSGVGGQTLPTIPVNGTYNTAYPNSEVMGILMDLPNTSANANHSKNPQRHVFLNAKTSPSNGSGMGTDNVFRDPWGNPYIISLDANYDNQTYDAIYSDPAVSKASAGFVPNTGGTLYGLNNPVMVWSLGPDGQAATGVLANQGVNADNITSW